MEMQSVQQKDIKKYPNNSNAFSFSFCLLLDYYAVKKKIIILFMQTWNMREEKKYTEHLAIFPN